MRVSAVWCENLHSGVLPKAPHACQKVLRTFDFSSRFSKKTCILLDFVCISQMCIFHEKIITFLFVTLLPVFGFGSNFYRRRKIQLSYWIYTLQREIIPFPRFLFLKTWNFHCTRTSKNWKIHDFFWVFSFVFILFSKCKIVRRTRFCRF